MTFDHIERVFGRTRLQMVTGAHVEVFREAAAIGESRRYTKRFLDTADGDYAQWTEREWRILARLIGHGLRCVPDVVQYEGGARGEKRVQTFDAGATVDQWATLLAVERDGRVFAHVFEDCAHWWALAHHCLVALDEIHALDLVHLDIKADNVCIPIGPPAFDPWMAGQRMHPVFRKLKLIDFAFSLVSGETLEAALPIGWERDYDYQSPRLLAALEAGRAGNLAPTEALDWRCDMYSLAAMLRRYLPRQASDDVASVIGWTAPRVASAHELVASLREAHDRDVARARPHQALIARTSAALGASDLVESLDRGWALSHDLRRAPVPASPTPVTRLAPAVRVVMPHTDLTPMPPMVHAEPRTPIVVESRARTSRVRIAAAVLLASLAIAAAAGIADPTLPVVGEAMQRVAALVRGAPALADRDALAKRDAPTVREDRPAGEAPIANEAGAVPDEAPVAAPSSAPAPMVAAAATDDAPVTPSSDGVPNAGSASTATPLASAASRSLADEIEAFRSPSASRNAAAAHGSPTSRAPRGRSIESRRGEVAVASRGARGGASKVAPTSRGAVVANLRGPARGGSSAAPSPVAAASAPVIVSAAGASASSKGRTANNAKPAASDAVPNVVAVGTAPANVPTAVPDVAANATSPIVSARVANVAPSSATAAPNVAAPNVAAPSAVVPNAAAPNVAVAPAPAPPADPRALAAIEPAQSAPWPFARAGGRAMAPIVEASRAAAIAPSPAPRLAAPQDLALARPSAEAPLARVPTEVPTRPPAAHADDVSDERFRARARNWLADALPRASSTLQSRIDRVLWSAAAAAHPAQDRAIIDAARAAGDDVAFVSGDAPGEARRLHDEARRAYRVRRHVPEAFDLAMKAFGANPGDADVAGHLAFLHLRMLPSQPERARQLALYALGLGGAATPARSDDWTTFAVASALTGRAADARHALYASAVLSRDAERTCRSALAALATYGDRLREPVESLLQRMQRRGDDASGCAAPRSSVAAFRYP